jgi:hypothetical protein
MRACSVSAKLLLVSLFFVVLFLGCAKEDEGNPVVTPEAVTLWIYQGNDSTEVSAEGLPTIDVEGLEAVHLSEFISTTLIPPYVDDDTVSYDRRPLFSYEVQGEDGFSASANRGYYNNIWSQLTEGYLILSTGRAGFPSSLGLPGAYSVSDAARILVYRKFDLETPDSTCFVEFKIIESVEVTNHDGNPELALPLWAFVDSAGFASPENYTYNMRSIDDFGPSVSMTWEQLQTGYWLLVSEKTLFTDPTLTGGRYKIKYLQKIILAPVGA